MTRLQRLDILQCPFIHVTEIVKYILFYLSTFTLRRIYQHQCARLLLSTFAHLRLHPLRLSNASKEGGGLVLLFSSLHCCSKSTLRKHGVP